MDTRAYAPVSPQAHPYTFHFKLVGKIALAVAAAAALGMPVLLRFVTDAGGLSYGAIIGSRIRVEEQLAPTLWFFGLLLVALSAVATWLFALYGSFRVAGPLHRFGRNLDAALADAPGQPAPIRRRDVLQAESGRLLAAVTRLGGHYGQLHEAVEALGAALAAEPRDAARIDAAMAQLRQADDDVRL